MPVGQSLVQVGGVKIPKRFSAHIFDRDDGGPDLDLEFEVRTGVAVPQCREVRVHASDDGHEVRSADLVGIRIQDVMELAVRQMMLGVTDESGRLRTPLKLSKVQAGRAVQDVRAAHRAVKSATTDALLREVAEVYSASIQSQPKIAVSDHFGVKHRTAALYVQRAREAGHLPQTTPGKEKA